MLLLYSLAFALCLWQLPAERLPIKIVSNLAQWIGSSIGVIWALQAMRRPSAIPGTPRRILWGPLCLALGITCFVIGQSIWCYYEFYLHRETPFPSWADAAFLGEYPFILVGIFLLPRQRLTRAARGRVVLDCLTIITAIFTISWFFLLGPTIAQAPSSPLLKILAVGYPLCDLLLLSCLLVTAFLTERVSQPAFVKSLSAGVLTIIVTDTVFAFQTLHETYATGVFTDVGWPAGYMLIGYSALVYCRHYMNEVADDAPSPIIRADYPVAAWRLIAPYLLVPAVAVLLWLSEHSKADGHSIEGVRIGSAILVGLIVMRQIVAILDNNRLRNILKQTSTELESKSGFLATLETIDAMTGLANHRTFHERLYAEMEKSNANGRALAVLMIDVDQFKRLNDTHGHTAGDEVLKTVASLVRQTVRSDDLVARYGGEEFAILLHGACSDTACSVAERIRSVVAGHTFPTGNVTVSIGVAPSPSSVGEVQTLMKRANHALVTAKHYGRNRVVIAEDLNGSHADRYGYMDGDRSGASNLRVVSGEPESGEKPIERRAQKARDSQSEEPGGQILSAMLALLDLRDSETEGHSQRVARFALRLADEIESLGIAPITEKDRKELALGSLLHDVGKIGVPDSILKKPGSLTEEEWEVMRRHPSDGATLLARFPIMCDALPVVRHHHERWDGKGYPDRLVGDEIPLVARIFAMADTFDAMSSDRVYRKALPFDVIVAEFKKVSGAQFDPDLVAAFLSISEEEWLSLRNQPAGGLGDWRLRAVEDLPEAA